MRVKPSPDLYGLTGLNYRGADALKNFVVIGRPAEHDDKVIIRVHPDDISARAARRECNSRIARPLLQPPEVTVILFDRAGFGRHLDPFFRDELFAIPFAAA